MSSRVRGRDDPADEADRAKRTYKFVKNGALDAGSMSAEEFGHLYLYYPWMLPDVDQGGGS